eukprot:GEMP01059862.1.p1 GENE.GEMP01059862.1~~GEMP01059862.1.p1  ORF type:complete len:255 (+),score=88.35 GEMP01059862.1:486-1250(+)
MTTQTSTVQQQHTSAYKYGILHKKSPSSFVGWQRRHCILAVDMLLYYVPSKYEGGEAGAMKGFIMLKDVLDVQGEGDTKITLSVKGRAFLWKGSSPEIRDSWLHSLQRAVAIINCQDPQITKEVVVTSLWSGELLGISLKERRVVSINWDGARSHGWQLGDVCIKVNDARVVDQAEAVEKLRHIRKAALPFTVMVMRYDHTSEEVKVSVKPSVDVAEDTPRGASKKPAPADGDDGEPDADGDGVIDPEEGQEKM